MSKVMDFISDLIGLVVGGIWFGLLAFIVFALVLMYIASVILTFTLILHLLAQEPIPWYEIVAPIIVFFGIGVYLYFAEG